MPIIRASELPTNQEMGVAFEEGIKSLVDRFRKYPYMFYTETDMHCYLYYKLYANGLFNGRYDTGDGKKTILLHKEYPTKARYGRSYNNIFQKDVIGRRGHYDICVWDPKYISNFPHRKQKVLFAAEVALNECGPKSVHTLNDATKLADHENEIKYGYLLYFVRDCNSFNRNKSKIESELCEAARRVRVLLAIVDQNNKPKPTYLGSWGHV